MHECVPRYDSLYLSLSLPPPLFPFIPQKKQKSMCRTPIGTTASDTLEPRPCGPTKVTDSAMQVWIFEAGEDCTGLVWSGLVFLSSCTV
jgi:hypothetical protein